MTPAAPGFPRTAWSLDIPRHLYLTGPHPGAEDDEVSRPEGDEVSRIDPVPGSNRMKRAGRGSRSLDWAAGLAREVELRRRQGVGPGASFDSLHVGGPDSVAPSPGDLIRFMELVGMSPDRGAEVALEVRPDEMDEVRVDGWIEAGVTRLSLRRPEVGVPVEWPTRLGLSRLTYWGVDVAFGIHRHGRDGGFQGPEGEGPEGEGAGGGAGNVRGSGTARDTSRPPPDPVGLLEAVIHRWAPPQVSLVEEVRVDGGGEARLQETDPEGQDRLADLYLELTRRLDEAGYRQWSFTAFALPGSEPRHHRAVLQGETYLGLGPGAHSHGQGRRFWNLDDPAAYFIRLGANLDPRAGSEILTPEERLLERLWGLLSLEQGLDLRGPGLHDARCIRDRWVATGLARSAGECVRLTPAGWLVMDTLIPELAEGWPQHVAPTEARFD